MRASGPLSRGRAAALATAALLAGCSLVLDTDLEGLACDANGRCMPGYVCVEQADGRRTCETPVPCREACPAMQECQQGRCVPSCEGRACPAGSACQKGACTVLDKDRSPGSPCRSDGECDGAGTFCLLPWGGGEGACSRVCESTADCGGGAPRCHAFPTGRPDSTISLCVGTWLVPCASEKDCVASDLSCGVYTTSSVPPEGITACRARQGGGMEIGSACSGPCVNGLCVRNGASRVCSTPCATNEDCDAIMGATGSDPACLPVTLVPDDATTPRPPLVTPKLCVPGGASPREACTGSSQCHADAPECLKLAGLADQRCVRRCDEHLRCPGDVTCIAREGDSSPRYCPP